MVDRADRRVAVLGGNRIPFARSDGAYAEASNQDMFTAALDGLVDRFGLQDQRLGAVIGGAVLKHSRDFNLMRECVLGSPLSPYTPAFDHPAGVRHRSAGGHRRRRRDRRRALRGGRRRRGGHHLRRPDRARRQPAPLPARRCAARSPTLDRLKLVGRLPAALGVEIPTNGEPRTGLSMGEHAAITAKKMGIKRDRPGRVGRSQPPQYGRRLRPRLLRRPRHAVPRALPRQQPARRLLAPRSWPRSSRCSASRAATRP